MKKALALVLTIVLLLSLAVTAAAAPLSSCGLIIDHGRGRYTDIKDPNAQKDISTPEKVCELAKKLGLKNAKEARLLVAFEYEDEPGSHTFTAPSFAGVHVVLAHYVKGEWKVEYDGMADATGSFTCDIESFSPFIILGFPAQVSSSVSPKTGDQNVGLMLGAFLLSALAAVYAVKAKRA